MPKMTKDQLAKRKTELAVRARAEIAKTEIVQFRVDAENINRLYDQAAKLKMPIGTMVRTWVLDRLTVEDSGEQKNFQQFHRDSIASLHTRLDRIEEILADKKVSKKGSIKSQLKRKP